MLLATPHGVPASQCALLAFALDLADSCPWPFTILWGTHPDPACAWVYAQDTDGTWHWQAYTEEALAHWLHRLALRAHSARRRAARTPEVRHAPS